MKEEEDQNIMQESINIQEQKEEGINENKEEIVREKEDGIVLEQNEEFSIEEKKEESKNEIKEQKQDNIDKGQELGIATPYNNKEKEETINIIKSKIKELRNNFNFYIQYHDLLFKIISSLENLTYEKISSSIYDYIKYQNFFKRLSDYYTKFEEGIKISTEILKSSTEKPKMNDKCLDEIMQSTQNMFYQNLSKFATGLKQNIIAKDPLFEIEEKSNKIKSINKSQLKKIQEINENRINCEKKFKSYEKLFDQFLPEANSINNENNYNNIIDNNINMNNPIPELIDTPDFIYIVKELTEEINKMILQINLLIIDEKDAFYTINNLFLEINQIVKDSIISYINESKIFFNTEIHKNFEEIEKYYKNLEEEQKENNIFKLEKIYSEQKDQENIFNLLQSYYELLNNSQKVKKELISDKNTFSIDYYPNIVLFFEWLISISPQPTDVSVDDLIIKKMEIKRDPGLFSKWRNVVIIFTKQKHMIIFDKPNSFLIDNTMKIFDVDKIAFKKIEDNKNPFLFEINTNTKGQIMIFKESFLFDGLNEENVKDVSEFVSNDK